MTAEVAADPGERVRRAVRWALAGIVVLAIALVATSVQRQAPFSPYDEYVYFDYLTKVSSQGFVRTGEEVGEFARAELECRGVASYGSYGDGCGIGDVDDDALFPYHGLTGADLYTPVYFAITRVLAQPLTWFGMGLLDAGRMVGGLWLAAAASMTFLALRRFRVGLVPAVGLVLLGMATPVAQSSFAYISTDAAAITAGAALALLAARVVTGASSAWWLVPVGLLGVLAKPQAIGALGAALLIVVVHALVTQGRWREASAWRGTVLPATVAGVVALASQLVWGRIRSATAVGPGANLGVGSEHLPPDGIVRLLDNVLLNVGAVQPVEAQASMEIAVAAATALACAGIVAGVVGLARQSTPTGAASARSWAIGTGALAVLMIPVLMLMTWVLDGSYFEPPLRYGAALLPFLLVSAGMLLARSRAIGWAVVALSTVLIGLSWS
ncbi:hypothetical protein L332_10760 [Agrococcus pavilionensis RW1]|uniref:Glycosyltransferase RgtA/B/C/D-like domain-containing protein n=1 Tax=Agrococcus pavilionensis RW1 TaxID=1330458 RepID=U1LS42_9MICO|nr:hypothetical protein [Agrococcus pavilionensis]ERG64922.1 hypothetical protein L332_10760 [Agrococcus pavilionensis RW1]